MNKKEWYKERVLERFLSYARIDTQSDHHGSSTPSTEGQWILLRRLEAELRDMGLESVTLNEHGYLIARLAASPGGSGSERPGGNRLSAVPVIGFMAHVDTSGEVSGSNVQPNVIESYDGGPVQLGNSGLVLSPDSETELRRYTGTTIITTDGTTLLGADDKAGAAEIMTAVQYLVEHPEIIHGPVEVIFTPDEETGSGMDLFPLDTIQAKYCYTLDGSKRGEIESECFNAAKATVTVKGVPQHLGLARGRMVNAVTMASAFVSMLPQAESPEATDGRYGYYCPLEITGSIEEAYLEVYLRDFEQSEIDRRFQVLRDIGKAVESIYRGGTVEIEEAHQYANMRDAIAQYPEVTEYLKEALERLDIEPVMEPIRGGTDGARLTAMGIPTPNIFTGGHSFHSKYEWAALETMAEAAMAAEELTRIWAEYSAS